MVVKNGGIEMDLSGFQTCHLEEKSILRERRVILGMTQQQVADKAHIVLQQYQKFESGERNIMTCSFQIACRIIEALEMDITAFFTATMFSVRKFAFRRTA